MDPSTPSGAPSSKTRLVFSAILTLVGIVLFGMDFEAHTIVAWIVLAVGVLSVVYNVLAIRAGK